MGEWVVEAGMYVSLMVIIVDKTPGNLHFFSVLQTIRTSRSSYPSHHSNVGRKQSVLTSEQRCCPTFHCPWRTMLDLCAHDLCCSKYLQIDLNLLHSDPTPR